MAWCRTALQHGISAPWVSCLNTLPQFCLLVRHTVRQSGGEPCNTSHRAAQVAQQLGFRSRRRPAGYWDNEDNLDREIAQFVAANWTQMEHPQSEESYWYNQVSDRAEAGM